MAHMGGPVGQPVNTGSSVPHINPESAVKKLNTAIYEYMICNEKYDIARLINKSMDIETDPVNIKQSPKNHTNGIDSGMDLDSKEHLNMKNRPDDLPAPQSLSGMSSDYPFLQDWWCQFWDLFHAQRGKGSQKQSTLQYIAAQRSQQKARMAQMGGNMDNAAMAQAMRQPGQNQMPSNLRMQMLQAQQAQQQQAQQQAQQQQALKSANMGQGRPNGITPQGNQMQASGMERSGSTMNNMSDARNSGSPNPGDSAPSPKRQRMEGSLQQLNQPRPGQPGQNNQVGAVPRNYQFLPQQTRELLAQHGINPESMPYEQLQHLSMQPAKNQAQSIEAYSQAMMRQQIAIQQQNPNSNPNMKVMPQNPAMPGGPNAAAAQQQNVMAQQSMDSPGDFYASNRMPNNNGPGQAQQVQQQQQGGNHALQDYQMQLMLLEQQNKKRLLMARQEQDNLGGGGHPNAAPGNNGMVDPSMNPGAMRGLMGGQPGQPMRAPNGHLAEQQMMMRQANGQMMPNNAFNPGGPHGPGGGPPGQMMPGQQPGGPPNMTPRQGNMPPPPAPTGGVAGPNQSSSPAPQPAPPTPNQNKGGKNTKKDTKNAKGPNKKGTNAAANDADAPPTPTPPPAAAPNPAAGLAQRNNPMANGQGPNSQVPGMQQGQVNMNGGGPPQQQQQNMSAVGNGGGGGDMQFSVDELPNQFGLDYSSLESSDVLDTFDFESFLNNSNDNGDFNFDANLAFADPIGGDGEGMGS